LQSKNKEAPPELNRANNLLPRHHCLYAALTVCASTATFALAGVAPLSSSAQCEVLPNAAESQKLTSYEELPPPIRVEISKRLEQSDARDGFVGPTMAERNSDWSRPGNRVDGLAQRRFIQGGQYKTRWYIWYVHSSGTYHMVIADLLPATSTGLLIVHLVTAGTLNDFCPLTAAFMSHPDSPTILDVNPLW
jgi:hypothetical protein